MRRLAALLALAVTVPAAAQDKPAWVGVWEGQVGTYPVRLCIDVWGDGPGRGSYYYLSTLEPIALSEADGEGGWLEHDPASDPEALWAFTEQTGEHLRGTWRQGRRSLPFDLKPVAWTEGDWGGPCSSAAFLAPRVRQPAEMRTEPAERDGLTYLRHIFVPPAHFRDAVSIESFSFTPEQPGDAAINAVLAAYLPRGTVEDEFLQCLGGAIASLGIDGYVEKTVQPMLASPPFLAIDEANSDYCGGAHPNHWQVMRLFDRHSGEEIDLFDWIGEPRLDGEDSVISDALRALVIGHWPGGAEAECREVARDAMFWSLGLAREGIVFQPDLAHVATACEERVTVEWRALAPFLDAEGRAGLARLQAD